MVKKNVIPLALLCCFIIAFLVTPVSAGLAVTDGVKITARTGNTSPVITVTDTDIANNGIITIDISPLHGIVANGTFTNANLVVDDNAVNATWTGDVTGDTLTLTATGENTTAGENVIVTFTGAAGSAWMPDTWGGTISGSLTATRTDTGETATINFAIETALGPGGLTAGNGEKITAADGATSMVLTITDAPISQYDTIIVDVSGIDPWVAGGALTNANVLISDTAANATWNGALEGSTLTLMSNNGVTDIDETVSVTFTGAGGTPWISNTNGNQTITLTAYRMDNYGAAEFNFVIDITPPPFGLTITDGVKITDTTGNTSVMIAITDSDIAQDGTVTIDVSGLNTIVATGTLTDANVMITDSAIAANWTGAVSGDPLTLTLTSIDGNTTAGESVTITFTGAGGNSWSPNTHGEQNFSLTAIRTDGLGWNTFNFVIDTAPPPGLTVVANFSATPVSEMAPLTVTFTDTSLGSPTLWSWDFGDGNSSTLQNPVYIYNSAGIYTVSLNATNAYGSDTKILWNYIHVLNGGVRQANTSIAGLIIDNCGTPQTVTVDKSILPAALIPNNSVLEIQPPLESGFKSITLYALNGTGFSVNGNLIYGNPTSVHLVSEDITPTSGFSNEIGIISSFNYTIDLPSYPCNAMLTTKIWEGGIPEYETKLLMITSNNSAVPIGTAYTAKVTKSNFPSTAHVKLRMSVNASWNNLLSGGPGDVYIWRIADDGNSGQILPTNYLNNNIIENLDYFEADSPYGLSTFGLSSLTGNNNPFQMIIFAIETVINPENPSHEMADSGSAVGSGAGTVGVTTTQVPNATSAPRDPGRTAKIYANDNGVITQVTTLKSTDGLATVNIGTGIVAKDAEGKPLSSITIKAIPSENLPNASPGGSYSFAGRAYELLPDGATFSPEISISFTAPNVQFGQELMVKVYNHATDTWEDVPSNINPETGIITAHISHFCCFALFAETVTPEPTSVSTPAPVPPKANAPAPTAMSTFVGMILWISDLVQKNVIIFIGVIILAVALFLHGRKRRRDRLMYLF